MALIGNITIGFQAQLGGLNKGAAAARNTMTGFQAGASRGFGVIGNAADNLSAKIAAGLGIYNLVSRAVTGIGSGFVSGIKGASDLNETLSMTNAVLGSSAPAVIKFADDMASKFGLVKQETLEGAAALGGLGKSLGELKGDKLDSFTLKMTKLAADLQSSKNLGSLKEATDAIGIGLAGNQSDVLKSMGVVMTEASVKAYAAANGIKAVGKELSEEQKLAARAGMITERLSFAHNDLENTSSGAANQFRKLSGGLTNFANDVGAMLLPAVTAATASLNDLLESIRARFEASKATFAAWGDSLRFVVQNVGPIWEIMKLTLAEKLANAAAIAGAFGANVVILAEYIGRNWSQLIVDGVNAASAAFQNFGTNLGNLGYAVMTFFKDPTQGLQFEWTPLLEGFKATAEKLPELAKPAWVSLQDEIDAQLDEIGKNEVARAAALAKAPAMAKAADKAKAEAPDKGKLKLADAAEMGSKEAFKTLAMFQAGGDRGDDGIKAVAKNGREHLDVAKETLTAIKGLASAGVSSESYSFA